MKTYSEKEKNEIHEAFKYANSGQLARVFFWNLFLWKKRTKLIECILLGMHFQAAYMNAKKF